MTRWVRITEKQAINCRRAIDRAFADIEYGIENFESDTERREWERDLSDADGMLMRAIDGLNGPKFREEE